MFGLLLILLCVLFPECDELTTIVRVWHYSLMPCLTYLAYLSSSMYQQQASYPAFGVIGGHWSACIVGGHCTCWNGRRRLYTGLMPGKPHQQNPGWLSSTALWHYGVRDMQSLDFTNEEDHGGHWHVQSSQWTSCPIGCHGGNWVHRRWALHQLCKVIWFVTSCTNLVRII